MDNLNNSIIDYDGEDILIGSIADITVESSMNIEDFLKLSDYYFIGINNLEIDENLYGLQIKKLSNTNLKVHLVVIQKENYILNEEEIGKTIIENDGKKVNFTKEVKMYGHCNKEIFIHWCSSNLHCTPIYYEYKYIKIPTSKI